MTRQPHIGISGGLADAPRYTFRTFGLIVVGVLLVIVRALGWIPGGIVWR